MALLKINPHQPEIDILQQAADKIISGGVIGYPTETVYGLGANATNDDAINKVFSLKGRKFSKPILVITSDPDQVQSMVSSFPEIAFKIAQHFWPGALTLVFRAKSDVNKRLLGIGTTIGIRIPDNKICLELLKLCQCPLTSTSANLSGKPNPMEASEVLNQFGSKLDMILDGGPASSRIASSVLDISGTRPILRREGRISKNELEQTIGVKIDHESES